jgi:hypothetical protein
MTTHTGTETLYLDSILSEAFQPGDFHLADYVYDAVSWTDDYFESTGGLKSITDRASGAFVFEINLKVNIDYFFDSPIMGYEIFIGRDGETRYSAEVYFTDDFKDIMDIGELDIDAIKAKLRQTRTLIKHHNDEVAAGDMSLTSSPNPNYVNLSAGSTFTEYAKEILNHGDDMSSTLNSAMPVFALPSAASGLGAVGHSSSPNPAMYSEDESRFTFKTPEITQSVSLAELRKQQVQYSSSEVDYQLSELAQPTGNISRAEIILGDVYEYVADFFTSKRKFEVPRRFVDTEGIDISFLPILSTDTVEDVMYHTAEGPAVSKSLTPLINSLFTPHIPPSIRTLNSLPGIMSYEINRGDPVINSVTVSNQYFDAIKGEYVSGDSTDHAFFDAQDTIIVKDVLCRNIAPHIPVLVCATHTFDGTSLTDSTVGRSHINKLHSGPYRQDTTVVTAYNIQTGHVIEITNIPPDVNKIKLYREDMSLPLSSPSRNILLFISENLTGDNTSYTDTSVANKRRYRYYVCCTRSSQPGCSSRNSTPGLNTVSSGGALKIYEDFMAGNDETIVRISPAERSLFAVNITPPSSTTYGTHSTINNFNISVTPNDSDFNYLTEALSRSGTSDFFIDQLKAGVSNLPNLVAFVVERINRATGDRTTLTNFARPNNEFVDTTEDLSARDGVNYIFKMCLVSPSILLTAASDETDPTERLAAISALSTQIETISGVMPSLSDIPTSGDSSALISGAATGEEFMISIPANTSEAKVSTFTGVEVPDAGGMYTTAFKLTWELPYTLERSVKSFIIYVSLNGAPLAPRMVDVILGDASNLYTYTDREYFGEVGTKTYQVACMFTDLVIGPLSSQVSTTRVASVPPESEYHMEARMMSEDEKHTFEGITAGGYF